MVDRLSQAEINRTVISSFDGTQGESGLRGHKDLTKTEEERAVELHAKALVIDASNVPIVDSWLEKAITDGYFERMKQGGVTASNITVPYSVHANTGQAIRELTEHRKWLERSPELAIHVTRAEDIERAKLEGRAGVIFGPQNAAFLEENLELLQFFYDLGVRMMQLTYSMRNFIGDGCFERANAGLSNFGVDLVGAMNEIGIVIDVSHCGHRTTSEAIELSNEPVVFSHAGVRSVFEHVRNKTDDEIKALAEKGGVIGITPYIAFLAEWQTGPRPTLDLMFDHVDYAVKLVGADHVGIGSDVNDRNETRRAWYIREFPDRLGKTYFGDYPEGFEHSVAYFPNITRGLVARGYSDQEILKILGGNFLRVFRRVWKP
jgi:membrane dipeptidase